MAMLYSLRFKPNWRPSLSPPWFDLTGTLDLASLPSISISAERGDVPLVASASDLTLTVSNAERLWDQMFDTLKIIGTLPPVAGETLRAPVPHFGEVQLCRKDVNVPLWQVVFVGFVDPKSPQFDRQARTCTFTAYAPGKLLEMGNAERVHRFHAFVPARPFVLPADGTRGAVQHPQPPGGDGTLDPDNSWWRLYNGATAPVIPLEAGDEVQVVRAVPAAAWVEGMETIPLVDTQFVVAQVIAGLDGHLYFQTTEASEDPAVDLSGFTASLELFNPWYHSRDWKALIDGSDGNANCLEAEVNAALASLDVPDVVDFVVGAAPSLPLLPAGTQLFAQPIYQPDVAPGCSGVSYARFSGTPFLAHQRFDAAGESPVTAKADILLPDSTAAPFNVFPLAATNVFAPGTIGGYVAGPDDGLPVQLLASAVNDQLAATDPPDYSTDDLPLAGQSLHAFNVNADGSALFFTSTHWCRAPSSYRSGTEPKNYYRIFVSGGLTNCDTEITQFETSDGGATWSIVDSTHVTQPATGPFFPYSFRSSRPSIKIFELAPGAFLYVWVNPFAMTAGITGGSFSYESATDDVSSATLMAELPFLVAEADDAPVLWSQAVNIPGVAVLFFSDRADSGGVDVYVYSAGPTWTLVTINDLTGLGIPGSLRGADWINAVVDPTRSPARLYVMVGKILYALHVSYAAGTLTIHVAQAVTIDQVNYDPAVEALSLSVRNYNAIAWLTGPVIQANAGEPDYTASTDALIVGSTGAVYIVSNVAANIVDVADFEGLSVAGALAKLILLRIYFVLTGADQDQVADPDLYVPVPTVSFYSRLETVARKGVLDITALTEAIVSGTWIQNYGSVQVQNSKRKIGPAISSTTLTNLDGDSFTINAPRNAASVALNLDIPFLTTLSFASLLANLFAQEFVVPRLAATLTIRDPYSQGLGYNIFPGLLVRYLLTPPDGLATEKELTGRALTIDYALDNGLVTLGVA